MGSGVKRLGVIGTMVWDTIYGRGAEREPVEEWGGIAYALAALDAALPTDWTIVPLVKVGRDLAPQADALLRRLTRRAGAARFVEVPQPNNRVTLRYEPGGDRRSEQLRGRVPPWPWAELGPMVRDLNALYINFIAGWELELETAQHLRRGFPGPIYADLHSLLLGIGCDGTRVPQRLPNVAEWFACCDVVQLNEEELALIGSDPMAVAAHAFQRGVRLLVVTLGARGATYFTVPRFSFLDRDRGPTAPIRTARVPAATVPEVCDPTGCGDVFGGTLVAQLIRGVDIEAAVATANEYAARNVGYRGASGLEYHLRGEIVAR